MILVQTGSKSWRNAISLTAPLLSPVCGVYPSQYPALFDAQRYRIRSSCCRQFCSRRTCEKSEVEKALHSQSAVGGLRSNHQEATSLLAGLSSFTGVNTLCCARICPVSTKFRCLLSWTPMQILGVGVNGRQRYYCLSILDKHHHPDIDLDQGLKILRMCTDELQRRLPIDFKGVWILPRA